jgi:hypothetical protein
MNEPNNRLPVRREPSPPPAPLWQQAAPAVIRGTLLVAAGVAVQWALRNAAKKAVTMPFQAVKAGKPKAVAKRLEQADDIITVSETIVMHRRLIVRR